MNSSITSTPKEAATQPGAWRRLLGRVSFARSTAVAPNDTSATIATRRARRIHSRSTPQSGVGLIEVLIAVLVLSIAFLGIAALQAMSLSTNNSAMARSMATVSSYSILDAMRADITSAQAGSYNTATAVAANACPDAGSTLATSQINQWCTQLGSTLGVSANTTGKITCTTVPGVVGDKAVDCTITITFDDSRAGVGGSSNQTVITRAML